MTSQRVTTRHRPTFRKSRASSSSRSVAVALALTAVALLGVVTAVVVFAHGTTGSHAQVSAAQTASASARTIAKSASAKSRRQSKHTPTASTASNKPASTAAKSSAASAALSNPKPKPTPAPAPTSAKPARSSAAVSKPARKLATSSAPKTLPEQMRSVPAGSKQIIVITGAKVGSRSGTMRIFNDNAGRWVQVFSATANFGANGLVDGAKRKEGNLQTPTGIWHIGSFLFGQHGSAPSGTKMRYRAIDSRSWWSCQRDSTYNAWVESSSHISGEHLAGATVQYEYAFDTGYNSLPNQRVMGRGTAIFIHCAEPAGNSLGKYTHGCIALSRTDMHRVFALLDPARHPSCAIGTLATGTSTSIYAY